MSYVQKINHFRACASRADLLELPSGTEALQVPAIFAHRLADLALADAIFYSPHLPNEHNKPHLGLTRRPALAGAPPKRSSTPPHWQMPSVETRASPNQSPTHHSGKCPQLVPSSLQSSSCPSDGTSAPEHPEESEPGLMASSTRARPSILTCPQQLAQQQRVEAHIGDISGTLGSDG